MKRIFLSLVALVAVILSCLGAEQSGSQQTIYLDVHTNQKVSNRERAPRKCPVQAFYEPSSNTICIVSESSQNGTSSLSYNGSLLMSSETISAAFALPYNTGSYEITIQSDDWIAYATLVL